ncbi:membrane protein [Streptomyces hygroscopicus]|uniref:Rv1733c family protein n=1 Tax=Streptomyces hygroscopicus TaxID=1912 RepID=UPI0022401F70|nr:hypothetical protein [Streptomyces hygroscopicus]MCW7943775.1 membrane protein [Streptomyces hygroscopicus]
MGTTRSTSATKPWFWRWRRNPLRRRSDGVEAWTVLVTWLLALLAGVFAGQAAAGAEYQGLAALRAHSYAAHAVLTEDPAKTPQARPAYREGIAWANVRWTTADGVTHTGSARVSPGARAGTSVVVWTDRAGRLVSKPAGEAQARLQASLVGALAGTGAAAGVLVVGRLVRVRLDRRRMGEWDREWEQVGPRWRRTIG